MRILYLINHAGKAGTEKYVLNLVRACKTKGIECFFAYNEEGLLLSQMKDEGIECFQVKMSNPFDLSAAKKIADICRKNNIDIIHTHYPRENYIAVLSKLYNKKTKVIYTCHLTLKTGTAWKITNKIITRYDDSIISVCNNGKELLIGNGVKPDKITVIWNGINYKDTSDVPSTIREELGIDKDTFVISTLARYHMAKGLPYFVRAIACLDKIIKRKYVVLIAGDGELFSEIKEQIEKAGLKDKILQLGFRNDAENILKGSDIFVNSAKCYEALSFAVLEALEKGLPVVVTNVGGNGDIVNPKTDCGFIVEYDNDEEMAKAINTLAEDNEIYKRFSENAVKTVKEVFNLDKLLEEVFDKYKEVLEG